MFSLIRYKVFISVLLAVLFHCTSWAQEKAVSGIVKNEKGITLEGAHVSLAPGKYISVTGIKGEFEIAKVPYGTYTLNASHVGYETTSILIHVNDTKNRPLAVKLQPTSATMDEVMVVAPSKTTEISQSGYTISAINPEQIATTSLNTAGLFRSSTGVNIRQSGGVGSAVNISINGLSGKMIRYFIDGIPSENSYLSPIYLVPYNTLNYIEIYKGVVPEHLSSDALGGAINFVSRPINQAYTDLSVEAGSYGLFRAFAGKRYISKKGFLVGGYFNYVSAQNDYPVSVEVSDNTGRVDEATVNRFHDAFNAMNSELELGLIQKSFADILYTSFKYDLIKKDLQHGLLMQNPAGEANVSFNNFENRIVYRKDSLLNNKLSIQFDNALKLGRINYVDTTANIYNWYGEVAGQRILGNEIYYFDSPHDADVRPVREYIKLYTDYKLTTNTSFKATFIYSYYTRTGSDPPAIVYSGLDPYSAVPKAHKTTLSLASSNKLFNQKLTSIAGIKIHTYNASQSIPEGDQTDLNASGVYPGVWLVLKWSLSQVFDIIGSYEYAYRLPDENELFGDVVLIAPNLDLKPERSHNINLGAQWSYGQLSHLAFNLFFRKISDIIYLGYPIHGAKYYNVFNTNSYGIDAEGKTYIGRSWSLDYGITWQELRNMSNFNYDGTASTKYYNTRLPNIPWLYGNLGVIYSKENLLMKNSKTIFRFRTVYVQEYFLRPEVDGGGSSKYTIPTQFFQNIGFQHYFTSLNLSVGMEVQNIFDQDLYDNFKVQRPGRTIQFLIRYQINK